MFRCTPLSLTLALGDYPTQFHRKHFHKSHHFDFINKIPLLAEANRPGFDGPLHNVKSEPNLHPRSTRNALIPAWMVYEKEMLCFYGYFKDTLTESKIPYQIRTIKLVYYLEDDTIQITEPRSDSGIIKGCLVSRQRIKRKHLFDDGPVTLLDLNVDKTISLLDRVYHLTDCDAFTRQFLERLGITVPSAVETPLDPTTELRRREKESLVPKHPFAKDFRFAQFLQNDRKVLRFSGYWDDTKSINGDIRHLEVLYHLADDTVEIKEKLPPNSGRQSNGMFLKRGKLPRHACKIREVGEGNFSVLNVLGRDAMKGRYLRDRLETKLGDSSKYYNEKDLAIGRYLNVFGRDVLLTDCDGQTKEFYRQKYGVEEFESIPIPMHSQNYFSMMRERKVMPPFNGWGSFEDSEGNCVGIEPKAPKIDFRKFLCYDKLILRFGAKMISDNAENCKRNFTISYHLADDTISVFEHPCRNFGFVAGEFFGKAKFYLPGQCKFTSDRPIAYRSQDFYLGATVTLRDFVFRIVSADLFALKFMEDHKELYPMSHASIILTKVREKLRPIYKDFIARYMTQVQVLQRDDEPCEFIDQDDFRNLLIDLLGNGGIVEQEIVTLCRNFAVEAKDSPRSRREAVRSIVQGEIVRELWDDIARTKEFIYHLSPENVDFLSEQDVLKVVRACLIPLDIEIVRQMFQVLNRNEGGQIEVKDLLNFIDTKSCKAPPVPPVNPKKTQFNLEMGLTRLIDWKHFINSIGLEDDLKISGD